MPTSQVPDQQPHRLQPLARVPSSGGVEIAVYRLDATTGTERAAHPQRSDAGTEHAAHPQRPDAGTRRTTAPGVPAAASRVPAAASHVPAAASHVPAAASHVPAAASHVPASASRVPAGSHGDDPTGALHDAAPVGGTAILAAHATGFCAAVLAPMAAHLGSHPVVGFDERGHGASGRPADGSFDWHGFADDALAVVDGLGLDRPLGFGHSCGGAALVLAEQARPGTFAGLFLFEPVIPPLDEPPARAVADNNPLSVGARRRRRQFDSRRQALDNFAGKPPFSELAPQALAAYVDNGFRPDPRGGITLCCAREDEAAVYAAAFGHGAFSRLGEVRCPVTVACGALTDAFDARAVQPVVDRLPDGTLTVLPGLGHFGPLQDPEAVAHALRQSAAWAAAFADPGTPSP